MSEQNRVHLRQLQIGPMANYVYVIGDPATHKAAVIDPAWNVDAIIDEVAREGYEIDKILITHYHPDHLGGRMMGQNIQGAADVLAKVKAKIYLNKHEAEGARKVAGLSDSDIVKVDAGDVHKLGDREIKFLHTPGHTPGSQCFLIDGNLVSGDTLFVNSCGRVDLAGLRSRGDVSQPQQHAAKISTMRPWCIPATRIRTSRAPLSANRNAPICTCDFPLSTISSTRWATAANQSSYPEANPWTATRGKGNR